MSMETTIGAEQNLLRPTPRSCRQIKLKSPILRNDELDKLRQLDGQWHPGGARPIMAGDFKSRTLSILFPVQNEAAGLERALDDLCRPPSPAIADGPDFIILSARGLY